MLETAARGEPWLTFLSPKDMAALMHEHGLDVVGHGRERDAVNAVLWKRSGPLRPYELTLLTRARVRRGRRAGGSPA
jgi:hypothetical protein